MLYLQLVMSPSLGEGLKMQKENTLMWCKILGGEGTKMKF